MSLGLIRYEYINLSSEDEEENEGEVKRGEVVNKIFGENVAVVKIEPCDEDEIIKNIVEDIIGKVVVTAEEDGKAYHKDKNGKEGGKVGKAVGVEEEPLEVKKESVNVLGDLEGNVEIDLKEENVKKLSRKGGTDCLSMEKLSIVKSGIDLFDEQQNPVDVMMPTFSEEENEEIPENHDDKDHETVPKAGRSPLPKRKRGRPPSTLSNRVKAREIRENLLEPKGTRKTKVVRMSRRLKVKQQQNDTRKSLQKADLQDKSNQQRRRSEHNKNKKETCPTSTQTGGNRKKNDVKRADIYNCPFCDLINMEKAFYIKHLETHMKLLDKSETKTKKNVTFNSFVKREREPSPPESISPPVSPLPLEEQTQSPVTSLRKTRQRSDQLLNKNNSKPIEKPLGCPYCPKFFRELRPVGYHVKRMHGKDMKAAQLRKIIKKPKTTQSSTSTSKTSKSSAIHLPPCSILLKRCDDLLLLPNYSRNQSSSSQTTKTAKITSKKSKSIKNPLNNPKLDWKSLKKCPECKKTFKSSAYLKIHYRIHSGEKPFKCSQCSKQFYYQTSLKLHYRVHSNLKPLKCPHCTFETRWEQSLQFHIGGIHNNSTESIKKSKKRSTNIRYRNISSVKINQPKNHQIKPASNGKPYRCTQCSKTFDQIAKLESHLHCHRSQQDENTIYKKIKKEKGTRTEYECNNCKKLFNCPKNVRLHQSVHTGQKPYSCAICLNSYTQSGSLRIHVRTHNEEQPFKCPFCQKRDHDPANMKKHVIQVHKSIWKKTD